jgi:hypothetical protein
MRPPGIKIPLKEDLIKHGGISGYDPKATLGAPEKEKAPPSSRIADFAISTDGINQKFDNGYTILSLSQIPLQNPFKFL